MIEAKNITKRYGRKTALEDVSLKVGKCSIYGLAGCNGAGKTTLIKLLAGIYRPDNGEALIDGNNSYDSGLCRQRLFYVSDEIYFRPHSTVNSMSRFYAGYYPAYSMKRAQRLAGLFGLDPNARISGFSKGMKRQAELVFALSCRPNILLLDEVFDGIDPVKRNVAKHMLLEYIAEEEASVLISSHNLPELNDLADHIGLLSGTRLIINGDKDEVCDSYRKFRLIFDREISAEELSALSDKSLVIDSRSVASTSHGD